VSDTKKLSAWQRFWCLAGALVVLFIAWVLFGLVRSGDYRWWELPGFITFGLGGLGLVYLGATGRRSAFVEALVESALSTIG
jgi:hypothetical protein